MKKLFVFDLDNTLRSTNLKAILPNTRKLIQEIASNPNYILALATGRGYSKLNVLGDLAPYFKYKIIVNGALTLENQKVLFEHPIDQQIVNDLLKFGQQSNISLGLVGLKEEVVTHLDSHIEKAFTDFVDRKPKVDKDFHLNHSIYQIWIYHEKESIFEQNILSNYDLDIYHWHAGGFDIVAKNVSKAKALLELKIKYPDHQVIAFGDGHNDIDMLEIADVGIIMENSRWIKSAKGKYDFIAPHVDSDELYNFLITNKIL